MNTVISANKANCLFWLGRYAERGYLMLHLMRRAYDEVIDVPVGEVPYSDFLEKLDVYVSSEFTTSYQMMAQIYDPNTVTSLRSIIEFMMDNAIILRSEIYSESFSYIELCRDLIRKKADSKEMNITELQPITDWLLAFWGSIRERTYGQIYALLEIGRLIEHSDMIIRFDYKINRLEESWDLIKKYIKAEPELFDMAKVELFEKQINEKEKYEKHDKDYKDFILTILNEIVLV
ncbi:MAG: alpha-E domain-containing protein [Bacteroidales bacterium]|nr:alpha-E domain-containing protein [Bacteroidales bacterium]